MQSNQPRIASGDILNVPKRLFWDFEYEEIDWKISAEAIVQRVIERGTHEEWEELIRFYSKEYVLSSLKNEINYLPDMVIRDVCDYFTLAPTELKCYIRKQSNPGHWI